MFYSATDGATSSTPQYTHNWDRQIHLAIVPDEGTQNMPDLWETFLQTQSPSQDTISSPKMLQQFLRPVKCIPRFSKYIGAIASDNFSASLYQGEQLAHSCKAERCSFIVISSGLSLSVTSLHQVISKMQ